jgi:hypothetical protein
VYLGLRVNVVGSVVLFPSASLQLRPSPQPGAGVARLVVRKDPEEKGVLAVSGAGSDAPWLKVSARRVESAAPATPDVPETATGDWVLEVWAEPLPERGSRQTVRFRTGLPTEPVVDVPVLVVVRPRIHASADRVRFGPVEADGLRKAVVLVVLREDAASAPLTVAAPPGIRGRAEPAGDRRYRVHLAWDPSQAPAAGPEGQPAGTVLLRAGDVSLSLPIGPGPGAP